MIKHFRNLNRVTIQRSEKNSITRRRRLLFLLSLNSYDFVLIFDLRKFNIYFFFFFFVCVRKDVTLQFVNS